MRKNTIIWGSILFVCLISKIDFAQPIGNTNSLKFDKCVNFDDLTVGGYVADQLGGDWTTWNGLPGTSEDAVVSDMFSQSPLKSMLVENSSNVILNFYHNKFLGHHLSIQNSLYYLRILHSLHCK